MNKEPAQELGSNQVDLGGMRRPASATAKSSLMEVGYIKNAAPMRGVRPLFQLLRATDAADEFNTRIGLGVVDPQDGAEDAVLQDGDVEAGNRVVGLILRADPEQVPSAIQIQAELTLCGRDRMQYSL